MASQHMHGLEPANRLAGSSRPSSQCTHTLRPKCTPLPASAAWPAQHTMGPKWRAVAQPRRPAAARLLATEAGTSSAASPPSSVAPAPPLEPATSARSEEQQQLQQQGQQPQQPPQPPPPQQQQQQQQQQQRRITKDGPLICFEEVQQAAAARGLSIHRRNIGPFYQITCTREEDQKAILAVSAGFVAPWSGLMHCDSLQVFTKGMKGEEGQRVRGGPLGLGLLMSAAVLSYGHSCGCSKAEILAINDEDEQHRRLVRYYTFFGFKPVRVVGGNGLSDWPHLLVWGGEGTRMDADVAGWLRRWTPAIRSAAAGQ